MQGLLKMCEEVTPYAVAIRRKLHTHPEPSGEEHETIKLIAAHLTDLGISFVEVPDGGVLGYLPGRGPGKTVLLRADCDALRICEESANALSPKQCVSSVPGIGHLCGHDAHTAMLLATAKLLRTMGDSYSGQVILMFERGEEGTLNIKQIVEYLKEHPVHIDAWWANHVTAELPVGKIRIAEGPVNAGIFRFDVTVTGKGGHGANPSKVNNPIDCFVAIMQAFKDIRMRGVSPFSPMTVNVCTAHAGTAYNITPETMRFSGSCRYFDREAGRLFEEQARSCIEENCRIYKCTPQYHCFEQACPPTINSAAYAKQAEAALSKHLGEGAVLPGGPAMGYETLGMLSEFAPGVKCGIGIRNESKGITYPVHHPRFDMDEEGMLYGILANVSFVLEILS